MPYSTLFFSHKVQIFVLSLSPDHILTSAECFSSSLLFIFSNGHPLEENRKAKNLSKTPLTLQLFALFFIAKIAPPFNTLPAFSFPALSTPPDSWVFVYCHNPRKPITEG